MLGQDFSRPKVKRLPPLALKALEEKNKARRLAGLAPIPVKARKCLACGVTFESTGNRFCGCTARSTTAFCGREVL